MMEEVPSYSLCLRLSPTAIHRASAAAVPQGLQSAAEGADVFSEQIA
jgi:hypothetical protein